MSSDEPLHCTRPGTPHLQPEEGDFAKMYRKISYYWSSALLVLAFSVVLYGIGMQWNNPPWAEERSPVLELILFIVMLCWISLLEGCQISIVGLQSVDVESYKDEFPVAAENCRLVHSGANVERFLVGRQFLLLFNGFLCSRLGGAGAHGEAYRMGDWEWNVESSQFFWANSFMLLLVILAAQLVTQICACEYQLAFFNLPIGLKYTVVYPCLFVEALGFTHSTYLLKDTLAWAAGIDTSQADPKKEINKNWLHYLRVAFSVSLVIFGGVFLFKGLLAAQTGATTGPGWRKLPGWAAVILAIFFLFIMACAEGIQVSILAMNETDYEEHRAESPKAVRILDKIYKKQRNMSAFMVGRQFFVALMMIMLGKCLSYAGAAGVFVTGSDWGMPMWFNEWLLQTGFIGAVFVVNVAQLATQVTASIFPISFINNSFLYALQLAMLAVEASGVINAVWPLMWGFAKITGMKSDPWRDDEPKY